MDAQEHERFKQVSADWHAEKRRGDGLMRSNAALAQRLQFACERVVELEHELSQATQRRVEQRSDELGEIVELKRDADILNDERDAYREELRVARREIHTLRGELHGKDLEVARLQSELRDSKCVAFEVCGRTAAQESGLAIGDTAPTSAYTAPDGVYRNLTVAEAKSAFACGARIFNCKGHEFVRMEADDDWLKQYEPYKAVYPASDEFRDVAPTDGERRTTAIVKHVDGSIVHYGLTTAQAREHKARGAVVKSRSDVPGGSLECQMDDDRDDWYDRNDLSPFTATYAPPSTDAEHVAHGAIAARAEKV